MSGDQKERAAHSIVWGTALAFVVASLIWSIAWYNVRATRLYESGGYCTHRLIGSDLVVWSRPPRCGAER